MLAKSKHGQTICSKCRLPIASPEEWSRHQSDHTLEYWARHYGAQWHDVLQSTPPQFKPREAQGEQNS